MVGNRSCIERITRASTVPSPRPASNTRTAGGRGWILASSMPTRCAISHFSLQVFTNSRYFCRLSKKRLPHFRNGKISDIKASDAQRAFSVGSYKDSPLLNFEFKNLEIDAKTAGSIQYADHWTFVNTHIKTADGSVVKLKDCGSVTGLGEIPRLP